MSQNFKNPHGKNLDLWVRIRFVKKKFSEALKIQSGVPGGCYRAN